MPNPGSNDPDAHDATVLLARLQGGDEQAAGELFPLVYAQLREMAGARFRGQRADHTLQPTALVHEAYLKLIRADAAYKNKAHFCAVAATAMRQILMNHARDKRAAKRNADRVPITVDQLATPSVESEIDLLALDTAMTKLTALSEEMARLVELRFFGGLTMEEIAELNGTSLRSTERQWQKARLWLNRELSES